MKKQHRALMPTTYVIFGATGDLTRRLLVPALFSMHLRGVLPKQFAVLGFSRRDMNDESFRKLIASYLRREKERSKVTSFLKLFHYQQGQFHSKKSYAELAKHLKVFDKKWKVCTSTLFHLAVPPEFYTTISTQLSRSGLTDKCSDRDGWTRVLIEKPFGRNVKTAEALDKKLGSLFREQQIFRVDHYLAKEALQNILTFRFTNLLFEPVWNSNYIERVDIKFLETLEVGSRGNFYDGIGALRDVGQNHMLQMLSVIAMDNPGQLDSDRIRRERAKVIKKLKPISSREISSSVVRGQYRGYRSESNVSSRSQTETYFKLKTYIQSQRWKGVPFYLESGKALDKRLAEITVYFKDAKPCFCAIPHAAHEHQNVMRFNIEPDQTISVVFWARRSDFVDDIEPRMFAFNYYETEKKIGAYEKVIFDGIRGVQTLFASTQEVTASWKFITPILKHWKKLPLHVYSKGSTGPKKTIQ